MEPSGFESDSNYDFSDLAFVWEVEGYDDTNNQFDIQVNFTNAIKISPELTPDLLTIEITDLSRIVSRQYGKPLEMEG